MSEINHTEIAPNEVAYGTVYKSVQKGMLRLIINPFSEGDDCVESATIMDSTPGKEEVSFSGTRGLEDIAEIVDRWNKDKVKEVLLRSYKITPDSREGMEKVIDEASKKPPRTFR